MFEMFEEEAAWKDCRAEMFWPQVRENLQGIPTPTEYNDVLESKIHRNNNLQLKYWA